MNIDFEATDRLSDRQKNGILQLRSLVCPPEVLATLPGLAFTWSSPQWSVLAWDEEELVSRVGLIVREIMSNDEAKTLGGIGGVMTHPEKQGKGYASRAMRQAAKLFDEKLGVAFALLFSARISSSSTNDYHGNHFRDRSLSNNRRAYRIFGKRCDGP